MKRLYISSFVSTLIAMTGYLFYINTIPSGKFLLMFGCVATAIFCLIHAFWFISRRKLSSGASMYSVLLMYLFLMFKALETEGTTAMFIAGLFFFLLGVIAKFISVSRAAKQGVVLKRIDMANSYAIVMVVISCIAFAF